MENPYQPPSTNEPALSSTPPTERLAPGPGVCPSCGARNFTPVKFTWWGGALGPRLFSHVKCKGCGTSFNEKTGRPNTTAIVIYSVVITTIVIGVTIAINM